MSEHERLRLKEQLTETQLENMELRDALTAAWQDARAERQLARRDFERQRTRERIAFLAISLVALGAGYWIGASGSQAHHPIPDHMVEVIGEGIVSPDIAGCMLGTGRWEWVRRKNDYGNRALLPVKGNR